MLAANAELEAGPGRPAPLGGDRDQLADALDVDADERVAREDALFDIGGEEAAGIVAADAQGGLGEIVGAEAEEFGLLGDVAGARARRGAARSSCRPDSRRCAPCSSNTASAVRSIRSRMIGSSALVATSGTITSGIGASPSPATASAASKIARACIS